MGVLDAVLADLNEIPGVSAKPAGGDWEVALRWEEGDPPNPKVALANLRQIEKSVRSLKRDVIAAEKDLRAQYAQAKADATYKPGIGGMLFGSKYRSGMRSAGARQKETLTRKRDQAMEPYERAKRSLDELLDEIARAKDRY